MASESIVNIYIVYKLSSKTISSSNALKNSLFGATEVTKPNNTTDPQKYIYSGWGLACDRTSQFTHPNGGWIRNVIIFGADLSKSRHILNKTQSILILDRGSVQKLTDTTVYSEKTYSPNFTIENKTFCLSLHYNGDNCYLFVNGKRLLNLKQKTLKLKHGHWHISLFQSYK